MSPLAAIVDLALAHVLARCEAEPALVARLRALWPANDGASGPAFLARRAYADRVDLAPRTVDRLLAAGLPHAGRGRLLRVDVRAADAWLRTNLATVTDEPEDDVTAEARANARRRP